MRVRLWNRSATDMRDADTTMRTRKQRVGPARILVPAALVLLVVLACSGVSSAAGAGGPRKDPILAPPQSSDHGNGSKSSGQGSPSNSSALPSTSATTNAGASAAAPRKMKLLVISADGATGAAQTDLPAIKRTLDQLGTPYDVFVATEHQLTMADLVDGTTGKYQGVILETGSLVYYDAATGSFPSAFDASEWQTLWDYEAQFGVRQVTWYTYPFGSSDTFNYGLTPDPGYADTQIAPLDATLTTEGKSVFNYLNTTSPITFKSAWVYLPKIADPTTTTPLLTTADGSAIASVHKYADGRENLAVTADNNWFIKHSQLLSYGLVTWVARGMFLGERHVYFDAQVDDLLIDDDIWDPTCNCDFGPQVTTSPYRLSGEDFNAVIAWQNGLRSSSPLLSSIALEFPFNGEGSSGIFTPDTLTPAVQAGQANFNFINHTWSHPNLDAPFTYADSVKEIKDNNAAAQRLGLKAYKKTAFVQPDISGLANPEFLRAAVDAGIKYLISDASRQGWGNPTPNAGMYSTIQPSLLIIPRHANNLFYNVTDPAQWVDEFNCYYSYADSDTCYGVDPVTGQPKSWKYFDHNLTYDEILDWESNALLDYMLRWDLDPVMFHQPNLAAYDGTHSLLGDLLNLTFQKYMSAYSLPVRNIPESKVGELMTARMTYNASGASATLTPCSGITLTTANAANVPITGVSVNGKIAANASETYGGQLISTIRSPGNNTAVTFAIRC
jgi:hypothetical protein